MASQTHESTHDSYHHGDLRRALLEATLEIIDRAGLEAVSLRAVARQLGVSEAAPYHHFTNKQDLLAVLAADSYRGFSERLTTAMGSGEFDGFERLGVLIRAYIEYGLENRGRYRLMFGEHMLALGNYIRIQGYDLGPSPRQILKDTLTGCIGPSQDAESIENIIWALNHGITGLINEAEIQLGSPEEDTQHLIDTGIAILTTGIRHYTQQPPRTSRP